MGSERKVNQVYREYRALMKKLRLNYNEYVQLKRAFMGGFTHASPFKVGKVIENVHSYDFTSSYPYVMLSERFPMSKPIHITIKSFEEFEEYLKYYACVFDINIKGLSSKFPYEHYISYSKARGVKNPIISNGRIVSADELTITITEQDYMIIKNVYSFKEINIYNFMYMKKEYLPKNFWLSILHFYKTKTELKGVAGKEVEYMVSKENANSCYGMTATDIVRASIEYEDNQWKTEAIDDGAELINKHNKSKKRFLFYPWGVWVTAYARRNLWSGIFNFGNDYIYSDTDSIKVVNKDKHQNYIDYYNNLTKTKLTLACNYHKVDTDLVLGIKNNLGELKPIGVWDLETSKDIYTKFKTLGAKRYIYVQSNRLHITIAGLSKANGEKYLVDNYGIDGAFDMFTNELSIPAEYTGKLTHTYIDEERKGVVKDYNGVEYEYDELSALHLEPAPFELGLAQEFLDFIMGVQENESL